jgi:hypothetical protein
LIFRDELVPDMQPRIATRIISLAVAARTGVCMVVAVNSVASHNVRGFAAGSNENKID